MKLCFALVLMAVFALGFAQTARADDFGRRAAAGRAASASPGGDRFANSLVPLLDEISDICDPRGTKLPKAELGQLRLVGDITRAGALTNVAVEPQTSLSACFAAQLARHRFDPPPSAGSYPLYITLTVTN